MNQIILLLALFILSFILTYFIKNYATKKHLIAEINDRSLHSAPIPYGGGIAIAITWFLGISYLYIENMIENSLYFALMVGIIISVISYMDDLYELSAKIRLFFQALVAFLGLFCLDGFNSIDFYIFTIKNHFFTDIFAFFMIIWFVNLYNFLDGIDGYAGSEAVFIGISGYILFGGLHFLVLVVSVFGFLIWNWHKAKIFMGDVGSTLLGYTVSIFTIYYANQNSNNLWIWIALFSPFWADATLTLIRRYKNREKLLDAHKKHFYQRLVQSGWNHSKVSSLLIFLNIIIFVLIEVKYIFISIFGIILILYIIKRFIDIRKAFE